EVDQLGRKAGQPVAVTLRPSILHDEILAFHPSEVAQSLSNCVGIGSAIGSGPRPEHTDAMNLPGLVGSAGKPGGGNQEGKKQRQSTARHWMTMSARATSDCGIVMPSAFAVFSLTTSSNVVGCSTGRSAGFAPRRILSTYTAARCQAPGILVPYESRPPASG